MTKSIEPLLMTDSMKNGFLASLRRILIAVLVFLLVASFVFFGTVVPGIMPGSSFSGTPAPLTETEIASRGRMREHVTHLAQTIGSRQMQDGSLDKAADYILSELHAMGYTPEIQQYEAKGYTAKNIIVEIKGSKKPEEVLVIGGHYDTAHGHPGANDNGTGTATTLELARIFKDSKPARTLRFVAFANEEPPYFQTENMGSLVYARSLREKSENVIGMISLETMGYYSDKDGSQKYPPPLSYFYPDKGNFIGFVSNRDSRAFLREAIGIFREHAQVSSEGGIAPEFVNGIGWSDHWSFWRAGYPGIMVTDTAIFRYPHYHQPTDTVDKINFDTLTRVVTGLEKVVAGLAGIPER